MQPTRKLDIMVLDTHEIPVLAQFRLVKVLDGDPLLRQAHKLLPVNTRRICEHAAPIDDRDCLIRTK